MRAVAFAVIVCAAAACGGERRAHALPPVDAPPGAPIDAAPCNPLLQLGCAPGEKCTWLLDAAGPPAVGHVGCAPDFHSVPGATCAYGAPGSSGYDNCEQGQVCVAGVCEAICDLQGVQPLCNTTHTCTAHPGLFGPSGAEVAGVCDPR